MCDDYSEGAYPYREEKRRARKHYICKECSGPVPRGAEHIYITGLAQGEWFSGRVHLECNQLWDLVHAGLCGGHGLMMLGGLREELEEHDQTFQRYDEGRNENISPGFVDLLDECADGYRAMSEGL